MQAEVWGSQTEPRGKKAQGGAGGEKKRDRCREEEIRPRGQSIGREGALGRTAAGTMSTGRWAERRRRWGGDRQRQQRAEETDHKGQGAGGTSSRPSRGGQQARRSLAPRDPRPPLQRRGGCRCAPAAPAAQARPQGPAAMLPPASLTLPGSAPSATLILGLT